MRDTTGVHDVPSVPLFPYGNMVQTGLFGTHGTGWDSYFVQTILYSKCPCVSRLSHRPTVPVIPVVLGHTGGTWWTDARQ